MLDAFAECSRAAERKSVWAMHTCFVSKGLSTVQIIHSMPCHHVYFFEPVITDRTCGQSNIMAGSWWLPEHSCNEHVLPTPVPCLVCPKLKVNPAAGQVRG